MNTSGADKHEVCAPPDPAPITPLFDVPLNSVDCHAHIFDAAGASILDPERSYSPSVALSSQYFAMQSVLGLTRGVIVQPSIYGTDNRTTLDVVSRNLHKLRAVVVVDDSVSRTSLLDMHKRGARGVRVNLLFPSSAALSHLKKLCATIKALEKGWHMQILADVSSLGNLEDFVNELSIDVVFDHFGHTPLRDGIDSHPLKQLTELLSQNRCWIKLSAPYRISSYRKPPYSDVDRLARILIEANASRLLWGSDWPHPKFAGAMPNDGVLLNELARWAPDQSTRETILVENPTRLYDF